jgi:hypothetical protein
MLNVRLLEYPQSMDHCPVLQSSTTGASASRRSLTGFAAYDCRSALGICKSLGRCHLCCNRALPVRLRGRHSRQLLSLHLPLMTACQSALERVWIVVICVAIEQCVCEAGVSWQLKLALFCTWKCGNRCTCQSRLPICT